MDQPSDPARAELLRRVRAGHDDLMSRVAAGHTPEFLGIEISMPQAKALYLVATSGGIHMSALAGRLRVTLSTVSGLVERLVEHGLVARHDDPADRRQVVVTVTPAGLDLVRRFREFNEAHLGALLEALDDRELAIVAEALEALARAAARQRDGSPPATDAGPADASAPATAPATAREGRS